MKDCKKFIQEEILNAKTVGEIIKSVMQIYGVTYNCAQKRVQSVRKSMETVSFDTDTNFKTGQIIPQERSYDSKTQETTFIGKVPLPKDGYIKPEDVLKQYHLSPSEWRVAHYTLNEWNGQIKGGGLDILRQYKLTVAPLGPTEFTEEDIANAIYSKLKNMKFPNLKTNFIKARKSKDGVIVEICFPDVHIGLLAWYRETGESFDLKLVYKQVMHAVNQIIEKLIKYNIPIKKIVIVTMGDLIHVDNDTATTTRGTHQQVDGRLPKITDVALSLMIDVISSFMSLAPVEYIYIPGNHDHELGRMTAVALKQTFSSKFVPKEIANRISFDVEPNPHKYRIYGQVALGWTHGDAPKKNLDGLMNLMVRDQTNIEYKCLHVGHLHSSHSHTSVDGGTYVEYLDSLCPASYWEHSMAFGKTPLRYVNAFLWDGTPVPPERIIGAIK